MQPGGQLVVLGKVDGSAEGEAQHGELRRHVQVLRDQGDKNSWEMAAALLQINREGLYHGWNYSSWRDYVEKELDFHIRKAQQLVKTEEWLCTLPKNAQAWYRTLTYTKARMLVGYVTAENAAEWRVKLEGRTVMEIDTMLHQQAKDAAADPDGVGADAGSERQANYIIGRPTPAMAANYDRALAVAAKAAGCDSSKDRRAYLFDLICTEYLAGNNGIETVQDYLSGVESVIGLRLVAYDTEEREIVYGQELLDSINAEEEAEEGDPDEIDPEEAEEAASGAAH